MSGCGPGNHNYFIAEAVGVEAEGKVFVLALCRSCGDFLSRDVTVSQKGATLRLLREEKTNKEL